MKYCSFEARKVIDAVEQYGITVDTDEYFKVENVVGTFWNTHAVQIVNQIMKGGDAAKKVERASVLGWAYFEKPIVSMLTPRGAAHRTTSIVVQGDHAERIYNIVTTNLLLMDFNMTELDLLVNDIPKMIADISNLSQSMQAARERNVRTIYYLHGIIQREYQTAQGRIKEIQEQPEDRGWEPPPNYEQLDHVDRALLQRNWLELQENAKFNGI